MLIRISLIVAILGGLGVGVVDYVYLKKNISDTIQARDTFNQSWHTEKDAHAKWQKTAEQTQAKLDQTTKDLVSARQERDDAVAKKADAEKALAVSQDNLKKTQESLDAANDKLAAWDALGIPIIQAREILNSLKQVQADEIALQTEKDIIFNKCVKLQGKIDDILGTGPSDPEMPDGLRGKVLAVDPKYDFVVLDIGTKAGAVLNGKLLVNRNGKLVAKLKITDDIQSERCIANVMPGWKLSDIMEGDEVFY